MNTSLCLNRKCVANAFSRFIELTGHKVHLFAEIVEVTLYGLFLLGVYIPDHHCKMAQAALFLSNVWLAQRLKLFEASKHGQDSSLEVN